MKQTLFFCCLKAGLICHLQRRRYGEERRREDELHDSRKAASFWSTHDRETRLWTLWQRMWWYLPGVPLLSVPSAKLEIPVLCFRGMPVLPLPCFNPKAAGAVLHLEYPPLELRGRSYGGLPCKQESRLHGYGEFPPQRQKPVTQGRRASLEDALIQWWLEILYPWPVCNLQRRPRCNPVSTPRAWKIRLPCPIPSAGQ